MSQDEFQAMIALNPWMRTDYIEMTRSWIRAGKRRPYAPQEILYDCRRFYGWTWLNESAPFFAREYLRLYPDETGVTFKLRPSAADIPPTGGWQMPLFPTEPPRRPQRREA